MPQAESRIIHLTAATDYMCPKHQYHAGEERRDLREPPILEQMLADGRTFDGGRLAPDEYVIRAVVDGRRVLAARVTLVR